MKIKLKNLPALKAALIILVLFQALSPLAAHAFPGLPLVPCGRLASIPGYDSTNPNNNNVTAPCNECDLFKLAKNIIDFLTLGLVPIVATFFFVWAGFLMLLGGVNPGWISKGKTIMWQTFLGLVVMYSAWLITNTLILFLGNSQNVAQNWWQFQCTTTVTTPTLTYSCVNGLCEPDANGTLSVASCIASGCKAPTTVPGPTTCQTTQNACTSSLCSQYVPAINQYAGGAVSTSLLKAIMFNESSCNIKLVSGAGAAGLMQLLPSTANSTVFKFRCGVSAQITTAWLTDPTNAAASICIASQYLQSLAGGTTCGAYTREIAAGYNAGSGACIVSSSCSGTDCDNTQIRRWECTANGGYTETRNYVPKVLYCYQNPAF